MLSGKALLHIFCGAFDGYSTLIGKFLGPSTGLSGSGLSRSGPEDQQVIYGPSKLRQSFTQNRLCQALVSRLKCEGCACWLCGQMAPSGKRKL